MPPIKPAKTISREHGMPSFELRECSDVEPREALGTSLERHRSIQASTSSPVRWFG
jgi:hypothetical protein